MIEKKLLKSSKFSKYYHLGCMIKKKKLVKRDANDQAISC